MNELKHIAIIPDGNRRWAHEHNLPTSAGHKKGADALKDVLEKSYELEIPYLSFWGASLSNLTQRSKREVGFLEKLYAANFKTLAEDKSIHERRVRIRVMGDWESSLGSAARKSIQSAVKATQAYDRFALTFLIAYDGTLEMVSAIEKIIKQTRVNPKLKVTPELVKDSLLTRDLPPVDLLIRTGGEPHLSAGFMMWDITESQLYFSSKYWPDFTGEDLSLAVADFHERRRKFGK